ncbi:sodium-dependent transporter, partial [[Ruminococcus] torques]|nr:sodium-dependent transporter [[Ruminococcus] torques]
MKGSKLCTFIGLIPDIGSLGIAIGYSVIIGWILKLFADSITGKIISEEDPSAIFGELSRVFGSIPWNLLGLFLVLLCMSFGVARGIEKVN